MHAQRGETASTHILKRNSIDVTTPYRATSATPRAGVRSDKEKRQDLYYDVPKERLLYKDRGSTGRSSVSLLFFIPFATAFPTCFYGDFFLFFSFFFRLSRDLNFRIISREGKLSVGKERKGKRKIF